MDWPTLVQHEGFKALDMLQDVFTNTGAKVSTTRCPIRIDGRVLRSAKGAPKIGEDNEYLNDKYKMEAAR